MGSELKGNAIVTGLIDYYCLACECHLRCEQDARLHVDTPLHRENLPLYPYLERFQEDRVRKIKKLYFCELCHLTFTSKLKLNMHSKEADHIYKRGLQHIKRFKNYVIISDGMLITELAWNGILDDNTCIVCSTEVDDVTVHLAEPKHVLNIIRSEAQFDEEIVYRKIDATSFHCLVCNVLFALNTLPTHSDNEIHKQKMLSCRSDFELHILQEDLSSKSKKVKDKLNIENTSDVILKVDWKWDPCNNTASSDKDAEESIEQTSTHEKQAILKELSEFQKSGIKVNFESEFVSCNKCSETMKFDTEIIKQHIVSHKNNKTKSKPSTHVIQPSHSKTDIRNKIQKNTKSKIQSKHTIPEIESDDESIKIDERKWSDTETTKSNKLSSVNDRAVADPSKLEQSSAKETASIFEGNLEKASLAKQHDISHKSYNAGRSEEHVVGESHKTRSEIPTRQDNTISFGKPCKIPFLQFAKNLFEGGKKHGHFVKVIINYELCVSFLSYHLIERILFDQLFCNACEIPLLESEVNDHISTNAHRYLIFQKPVITNWKNEFIREVRSGIFQCGFCDEWVRSWNDLNKHLQEQGHIANREVSERHLSMYLPQLRACLARKAMH